MANICGMLTVVKQRLQMYNSPFRSMLECTVKVYRAEGLAAFYRAYGTQVVMNVPFQSVHFIVYEAMQNRTNPDRSYNPKAHVISGGISGAFAAAITTPLDVCKTLLNTQVCSFVPLLFWLLIDNKWFCINEIDHFFHIQIFEKKHNK